jgi:hypothetical protein
MDCFDSLHKGQCDPQQDDQHMKTKGVQETVRRGRAVLDLRLVRRSDWDRGIHPNLFPFPEIIHSFHEKLRLSIYNL